jgi:DNA polymerase III gamma/tau subunit
MDLSAECMESILKKTAEWAKSKNEEWRLTLDVLENWFRDLAWIKHRLPEQNLLYAHKKKELEQCSKRYQLEDVYQFSRDLAETRKNIELNANRTLALESLWIRLKHYAVT